MKRAERAVQPSNEEINERIKMVLHRMKEVVEKIYPNPVPQVYIRVPFEDRDTLFVVFGGSVRIPATFFDGDAIIVGNQSVARIPAIFFPSYTNTATLILNRRQRVRTVKINFDSGKVRSVEFIGDNENRVFFDPSGDVALTYMLMPDVFKLVRNSYIYSENPHAINWFKEFIDTAEYVSHLDEVKHVDPLDLLNRYGRTELFDVRVIRPVKNLEELLIRLNTRRNILSFEMFFLPYGRGFVDCEFEGDELRDVKISASIGVTENRVRRYLLQIPETIFDEIKSSLKAFLNAYRLFRATISFMNL